MFSIPKGHTKFQFPKHLGCRFSVDLSTSLFSLSPQYDPIMITINNVKYGKVDGSLTLNLQELTEEEKKRVIPYARVLPALSFKPDTEGSATVYLPFITIASTY